MKQWNEASSKATTPLGDVSTNMGNGMYITMYLSALSFYTYAI